MRRKDRKKVAYQNLSLALETIEAAVNGSRIATKQFNQLIGLIDQEYRHLGESDIIPKTNAWKKGKRKDGKASMRDARAFARGHRLSKKMCQMLMLAAFAADIGRLVRLIEDGGKSTPNQVRHGADSADLLRGLCHMARVHDSDPLLPVMLQAVSHHSAINTPARDLFETDAAYYLSLLLRDFDKLFGFVSKGRVYVLNQDENEKQRGTNNLVRAGYVTDSVLLSFEQGVAIDRSTTKTIVDWLLQFLMWLPFFNFQEFLEIVRKDGAPQVVADYIRDELQKGGRDDQWQRVKTAAEKHGMIEPS